MSWESRKSSAKSFSKRWTHGLELSVIALLIVLFLNLLSWPETIVDESLDGSWQAILTYSLENGLQFGDEVIFTYGPLGGLSSFSYSGYNHAGKYAFELFARICMVVFLFRFVLHLRSYLKIGCILLYLFICQLLPGSYETFYFFGYLSWVAAVVFEKRKKQRAPWGLLLVGVCFLVFCSLIKFTLLVAALFCLGAVVWFLISQKRLLEGGVVAVSFPVCFILFWITLGQNPANIPAFVMGSAQVANGYAMSMQLATEAPALKYFVLFLASGIALFFTVWKEHVRSFRNSKFLGEPWFIVSVVYAGLFFMVWKQGVVRSDGHIWQFFCFVPLAGWFLYPVVKKRKTRLLLDSTILLQIIVLFAALAAYHPHLILESPVRLWANTGSGVHGLLKPGELMDELAVELETKGASLLETYPFLNQVGERTVDVSSCLQGLVILPGLNYQPRPVFQDYVANNAYLQNLNHVYWESEDAIPDAVIHVFGGIDNVPPTHIDSQTTLQLLSRYEVESKSGDYVLLSKRLESDSMVRSDEKRYAVRFGETVELDSQIEEFALGRFDMQLNLLGRVVSFFYKPPLLKMRLSFTNGTALDYRVNPVTTETDFLLDPVASNTSQLWDYRNGAPRARILAITIDSETYGSLFYRNDAQLVVTPFSWE